MGAQIAVEGNHIRNEEGQVCKADQNGLRVVVPKSAGLPRRGT